MKHLLMAVLFLLVASAAHAQINPVPAGQPFALSWDHSPAASEAITGYQCVVDGKPAGAPVAAVARSCAIAGQSVGTHTLAVEAINAFGRTSSPTLTATAGNPPTAPGNLRIQTIQTATFEVTPDGKVTLLASELKASAVAP